jgi:Arc/MetJ-type ribon-helix-helix transcriptional regulator
MASSATATSMSDQINARINDDLNDALEEFRLQHQFPPDRADVVRMALKEYLEREMNREIRLD